MAKVSVIIPSYNRQAFIGRAIDSVLAQTTQDYELIVVDDGSTDQTKEVLATYEGKIRYFYQSNAGISAARNRGIAEANGEYVAFLDSDDYWAPEKLAEQVKILDAKPKVGIVYGRMPIINEQGQTIGMKPAGVSGKNFQELIQCWGDLPTSTVMTRRGIFTTAGVFDPAMEPMEDIDMWIRISRTHDLYEIEGKPLAFYARHATQVTQDSKKVYKGLVKIYEKILKNYYHEVPQGLMIKRIASNQYTLSRIYHKQQEYADSWHHLSSSIHRYPLVGVLFFEPKDGWVLKAVKLLKPYGFLALCWCQKIRKRP